MGRGASCMEHPVVEGQAMSMWLFALAGWCLWLWDRERGPLALDRRELRAVTVGFFRVAIVMGALMQLGFKLSG